MAESPLGSRTGQRAAVRPPEGTGRLECAEAGGTRGSKRGRSLRGRARGRRELHGRSVVQRRLATLLHGLDRAVSREVAR